jgi:hypothetical protein
MEVTLHHALHLVLPERFLPESPHVVLVSLEGSNRSLHAMDIAMVLRGLKQYYLRSLVIDGIIEPESGTAPLLPHRLAEIKSSHGYRVIQPQIPGKTAQFQSLPLIRYSLDSGTGIWPLYEGVATPASGDAFFPPGQESRPSAAIPLLAHTSNEATIGSLWWWAISQDKSLLQPPSLLLFHQILILPNNTPIHLNRSGGYESRSPGSFQEIPLDDFLLQIEQKEQGLISPDFDGLWNNATVVLATHDQLSDVASFSTLLTASSMSHLSLGLQFLLMVGTLLLFLRLQRINHPLRWKIALMLLAILILGIPIFVHYRIFIPFASPVLMSLCLLIPTSDK